MPRDQKGQPFGIDTIVRTLDTNEEFKVCGFAVFGHTVTREQIEQIAATACGNCEPKHPQFVRFWNEVVVVHPEKNPWADHADHTDFCHFDVAQRDGLTIPTDHEKTRGFIQQPADKAVWGAE